MTELKPQNTLENISGLPTSTVTVTPAGPVFTGETVKLKCVIKPYYSDWRYEWYKDSVKLQKSDRYTVNRDTVTIRRATESDQGQYWCKGQRDGRPNSSTSSSAVSLSVKVKPVVTVTPDQHVFRGETVTLTCDIQGGEDIQRYSWIKDGHTGYPYTTTADYSFTADASLRGEYSCRGERSDSHTDFSDGVTLTVSDKPTLTVKPQSSVFTGDTVTLSCDVGRSTGWTFHWWKNSNWESSDDAGTKTISSLRVSDGGTYECRAERGNSYTDPSNAIQITVKKRPKPVVKVKPDVRVFRGERVTLTCDIQETGVWTYSWYKDQDNSRRTDQIYIITSVDSSHAGLYRCRGTQTETQQHSKISDGVTLTVSVTVTMVTGDIQVYHDD
ncbi:Fc receptor-like protein [Pimephales promelas]|nr:Fc receptor-like protein [Pimephales promelas]